MQEKWIVVGACRSGWREALGRVGILVAAEIGAAGAVAAAREHGAMGVLLDDAAAGPDPLATAAALVRAGLAVVLVGGRPDQEAIRRAMVLGVRDYVDEPFTPAELAQAVGAAATAGRGQGSGPGGGGGAGAGGGSLGGRLIAVCGPRGGSGRSCVALNLAINMGLIAGRPAAAVDLCLDFGALAVLCGLQPERTLADAWRASGAVSPDVLSELCSPAERLPLHVLASPADPSLAAEIAGETARAGGRDFYGEVLGGLVARFPWVVADLPPVPSEGWLAALDRSAVAVVVATPDVAGLAAPGRLVRLLEALGVDGGRRRVVLNAPWGPSRVTPGAAAEVVGAPVVLALPFDPSVGPAADAGQPLAGRRHRGPFARALANLARQLAEPQVARSAS